MACDILLLNGQLKVSSYLEIMDEPHQFMMSYSNTREELPIGATQKSGCSITPDEDGLIIDSARFVPMGVRVLKGKATGICINTGNSTIKALFKYHQF